MEKRYVRTEVEERVALNNCQQYISTRGIMRREGDREQTNRRTGAQTKIYFWQDECSSPFLPSAPVQRFGMCKHKDGDAWIGCMLKQRRLGEYYTKKGAMTPRDPRQ
jgi:hypothetical protein